MATDTLPEPFESMVRRVPPRHDRPISTEQITYAHDGVPLEGVLVEPDGTTGRRRAVLIFHAWMGVDPYVEARARMVAGLGYTAFAADVYGAGVRPGTFDEAKAESSKYYSDLELMRGRAQAGFDVLLDRGFAPEDIVVIGYCFGGTVALEHARTGQVSAGVVSFHGRLLVLERNDAAAIAAPLLILTGGDDEVAPDENVKAFADDLRTAPEVDWQITVYSGAPHAFTVPGEYYRPLADARSWRAFADFLGEVAPLD